MTFPALFVQDVRTGGEMNPYSEVGMEPELNSMEKVHTCML